MWPDVGKTVLAVTVGRGGAVSSAKASTKVIYMWSGNSLPEARSHWQTDFADFGNGAIP